VLPITLPKTMVVAITQLGPGNRAVGRSDDFAYRRVEDAKGQPDNSAMRLSERAEYAVHALIELAAAADTLVPAGQLGQEQAMPGKALLAVMTELRRSGLMQIQRGPDGGFSPSRPAADISLGEILSVLRAP
jgi:hypothetical protein